MIDTKYNPIPEQLVSNYFEVLINKFYKILPLYEERSETVGQYIDSLLYELTGNQEAIIMINEDGQYASLIGTLESLQSSSDIKKIKREIFKCIRIIESLNKKYFGR